MSDETVIVREQGTIFLGGPPLVKAATGEEVTAEELGGGDVHARTSGVVDHLADDDEHALEIVRGDRRARCRRAPAPPWERGRRGRRPRTRTASSTSCRSTPARPTTCATSCAGIVDGGELQEFKELYGTTVVCAFAHLDGHPVGIVANNGILFSESALKAAHFIELCDRRGVPLLFLQNISGFMVGRDYEAGGIAKDGAKMVTAVACARVPKLTVVDRRVVRRRQLRDVRPRVRAALPVHVAERAHQRHGRRAGGDGHARGRPGGGRRAACASSTSTRAGPCYSTARLWDDGVIDPRRHARRPRPGARPRARTRRSGRSATACSACSRAGGGGRSLAAIRRARCRPVPVGT